MSRLACVDVPALPLQILLRRFPGWREEPVAVLTEDKVQARVRWGNRRAITLGVRPGMRQAAAVACCPSLRIGQVRDSEVRREVSRLAERLHRFSPQVEFVESAGSPGSAATPNPFLSGLGAAGAFWLRASGLAGMFGPLPDWARALREDLAEAGFHSSVAVGFTRFGAFAAARAVFGQQVFESLAEEKKAAGMAPLVRFGLPEKTLAGLEKLDVRSLRDLLRLPGRGLRDRFGDEVHDLHRLASGETEAFFSRVFRPDAPIERRVEFESVKSDSEQLVFHAKRLLDELLAELGRQGLALVELEYELHLEDGAPVCGSVLPAFPSEDGAQLLSLLRLRLKALEEAFETATPGREQEAERRVAAFVLRARGGLMASEPRVLFDETARRDPKRASEALARIQAEFGEEALVRVETRDAHLPRGRYRCRPISPQKAVAGARRVSGRRAPPKTSPQKPALIRRIYEQPLVLPHRGRREPDGWLPRGIEHGPAEAFAGPYRVSGGWWRVLSGRPVSRDYFFVRMKRGDVYWIFFDRDRSSWFLEGRVE